LKIKPRMNTNEHEEIFQTTFPQITQMAQIGTSGKRLFAKICSIYARSVRLRNRNPSNS